MTNINAPRPFGTARVTYRGWDMPQSPARAVLVIDGVIMVPGDTTGFRTYAELCTKFFHPDPACILDVETWGLDARFSHEGYWVDFPHPPRAFFADTDTFSFYSARAFRKVDLQERGEVLIWVQRAQAYAALIMLDAEEEEAVHYNYAWLSQHISRG